jgi:subtilisin family serine protease
MHVPRSLYPQFHEFFEVLASKSNQLGIFVVAAAGNIHIDTCDYVPAAAPSVFAVSSSRANDTLSDFSNGGVCTDIIAPGEQTLSTFETNRYYIASGTSFSSPTVAGIAALALAEKSFANAGALRSYLTTKIGTKGAIKNVNTGTPNILAYNRVWEL